MLEHLDPSQVLGEQGYMGLEVLTPIKKPLHHDLVKSEKEFNRTVNRIHYVMERCIADLKTWRGRTPTTADPTRPFPRPLPQ